MQNLRLFLALVFLAFAARSHAFVRLPAILSSHMVMQSGKPIHLWGWCDAKEKVSIKAGWDTATYTTTGSSFGRWQLTLPSARPGGPYSITVSGYNTFTLDDVLIGEVWLCSGQSNMEMSVKWGLPYAAETAAASRPSIRFFQIPRTASLYPQDDCPGQWVICAPESMKAFSAVGYFFGDSLQKALNRPVGLIQSAWGGTPAEVWTPEPELRADTALYRTASRLDPTEWCPTSPSACWYAMVHPFTNLSLAGILWYQGESNVGRAGQYTALMEALIRGWRRAFAQDLPFYFVQIAPWSGYADNSAFLREAQERVLQMPRTGMVVTTDLVDSLNDLHPKHKKEIGLRLAAYALGETYARPSSGYKSPTYQSMQTEKGGRLRLRFHDAEEGLLLKGGPLNECYIAGADRVFLPARARIEGQTLVVWHPRIPHPLAVRFAFSNAPAPNLFSVQGLPVAPFRTDNW